MCKWRCVGLCRVFLQILQGLCDWFGCSSLESFCGPRSLELLCEYNGKVLIREPFWMVLCNEFMVYFNHGVALRG